VINYKNIIEKALLIRLVEEKLLDLFNKGKINGTVHTCIGQELSAVCLAKYLTEDDYVLSNHRGHGHLLSRDNNLESFFSELMGKKHGMCGGIGGSQHLWKHNHLSNGIQGGMTPIGAGIALANKIKNNNKITICYIGDGTLGEGVVYEAFNIASLWSLPIIYVIENNKIAQSTSIEQSMSGSIELRSKGFGMEYFKTNIWDIEGMLNVFEKSSDLTRRQQKACVVEVDTYRLLSHSKGDDNRDKEEIAQFKLKDIINKEIKNDSKFYSNLISKLNKKIESAVAFAENSPPLIKIDTQKKELQKIEFQSVEKDSDNGRRVNELIHEAIKDEFLRNKETIMIGEDIEYLSPHTALPYGGAFKVSNDLSENFKNVFNTPISEAAITGIGTGLAIGGMKPIVEIMFGDFLTLIFDQLFNHACKFNKMYNGQVSIPLIIRTPMGGKRGYGPTHSQSIEKYFIGIPDLSIVVLNHHINPRFLYKNIFSSNSPVLVIENKVLYTKSFDIKAPSGYNVNYSNEIFPTVKLYPENRKPDITILCYGEILIEVEKAVEASFLEEEIFCEVICPTQISPVNINYLLPSLRNTNHLLTVEEGSNIAAFSSEVSALIMEKKISLKSFSRIGNNGIIPSSYEAEMKILPNSYSIFQTIKKIYYE